MEKKLTLILECLQDIQNRVVAIEQVVMSKDAVEDAFVPYSQEFLNEHLYHTFPNSLKLLNGLKDLGITTIQHFLEAPEKKLFKVNYLNTRRLDGMKHEIKSAWRKRTQTRKK